MVLSAQKKIAFFDLKFFPMLQDRFISKMFLRGDSVILVLKNPM
jgi:hypothetical protein